MVIIRHGEDEVYKAAWSGCVESLNALIEKDPRILRNLAPVLLTTKTLTPLHISASLGHLEITKTLLTYIPELAEALNSFRSTPLHLASAEGHKEIVQALLLVYNGACSCRDEEGRIPLDYAAMRGHVEVLKKLTHANHDSIYLRVDNGFDNGLTVLHLCVKYNQLECLKFLVELVRDDGEFLNSKDGSDAGMTILQSALMRGQIQITTYLLSLPVIRAKANADKGMSSNMLGVLEHVPPPAAAEPSPNPSVRPPQRWRKKLMECLKYPNKWLEETRGLLMVVSTMISTMTFQAVVNPPGGVWQENNTNTTDGSDNPVCTEESLCVAGTAVLGDVFKDYFLGFIKFNTISFLGSLSVTLLLVSGIPLHHRISMWLLSMAMCVTLTFMALTYLQVLLMVVPYGDVFISSYKIYKICFKVWIGLLVMVSVMNTIRFLIWVVKKLRPVYSRSKSGLQKIISGRFFSRKAAINYEENAAAGA
ncbi:ankyrin repeat-containing protein At5g02620-like [Prunus avium]|uniref:Ankyrin repeat-containing protein At5g02620-like n=1 Tax=Prunus avium TaxID=42229 RepID=A0A6P5SHA0_PRUAV|nr:ankyrin repeat-containing protein At5g02620-like [Prunus avium]